MSIGSPDVLEGLRAAVAGEIAPHAARVDRERAFPEHSVTAVAATGAFGLLIPVEHGGSGGSLMALAEACEAIGSACASSAMVFLMHSVTAATIAGGGGPSAGKVLPAMASGDSLGSLAFSERGTGAHFYSPELVASSVSGGVSISGRKSFVTSAGHADSYLVLLRASDAPDAGADIYLVPSDAPGLRVDGTWDGLGMAGNSSLALEFHDVAVADENRIGEAGQGAALIFGVVAPVFLVGLAAVNVGIAGAATAAVIEHAVSRRYPDGSSLAEVPYIQQLIAQMDLATRQARLLVHDAARLGEAGDPSALVAIMEAKVAATSAASAVSRDALEATGGQGYTRALPIERHLRDAHAGSVMAPTNAVLRTWIGKALSGLPVP